MRFLFVGSGFCLRLPSDSGLAADTLALSKRLLLPSAQGTLRPAHMSEAEAASSHLGLCFFGRLAPIAIQTSPERQTQPSMLMARGLDAIGGCLPRD